MIKTIEFNGSGFNGDEKLDEKINKWLELPENQNIKIIDIKYSVCGDTLFCPSETIMVSFALIIYEIKSN